MKRWTGWMIACAIAAVALADDWVGLGPHRGWRLPAVAAHAAGFTQVDPRQAGITFTNVLSDDRSITNRNLLSGSGVALGDIDGDGWCDVYLCGLDSDNRLYRNRGGWKFEDVTKAAGVVCAGDDSTGAAFADVDGDGDLDLIVNALGGGTRLFVNDGKGVFTETTDAAGLRSRSGATSMALGDVDGDGDLDLYVANFRSTTILDRPTARFTVQPVGGHPQVVAVDGRSVSEPELKDRFLVDASGQVQETGEADVLWINDGRGRFVAASWTDGTFLDEEGKALKEPVRDWGLAARFHDVDGDGDLDLYVCNDLWTPDRFWINEGGGGKVRFRAIDWKALRNNPTFSMGVDFGDLNRDGAEDFFAVDMLSRSRTNRQTQLAAMAPEFRPPGLLEDRVQMKRNVLQLGRGDGTFSEAAYQGGVEASEWSWGPLFLDVDLDGYEDILVPNGQHRDFQDSDGSERVAAAQRGGRPLTPAQIRELVRSFPRLVTPKVAFRNRGDATFEETGLKWGFGDATIAQGAALADLDNDGDLDVVVNQLFEGPGLYRNKNGAARIAVELRGSASNPAGIGARITVVPPTGSRVPVQTAQVIAGGRYLSGDAPRRVFAAGPGVWTVRVEWPDGMRSEIRDAAAGWLYAVAREGATKTVATSARPAAVFEEVTARLGHRHVDEPFDDFQRQPLLPNRLSQLGPGLTWTDIDGDGREDLVVGTGKGGTVAVLLSRADGTFRRMEGGPLGKAAGRDLTTILPLGGVLLAGSSNYEDGMTNGGCIRVLDVVRGASGETVLNPGFSAGPMAMADVDGDGALDVFVGGRVVAGRYPEAAASVLLRSVGGRLAVVQRFEGLGMATGACFTDLDGDGDADLVVTRDWDCPVFWRNEGGRLVEWRPRVRAGDVELDAAGWSGWWNGVTAGDFDGDGRMDLVMSNWGRNTAMRASALAPRRLYFGDLGSGGVDLLETWVEPGTGREWPQRELPMFRMILPNRVERFATHSAYAAADVGMAFGEVLKGLGRREVRWLDTSVLMNRGEWFELMALPAEAQRAPAFGIVVADYDGNGTEDVFLAQNWFCAQPMVQRNDGGRGLWLRNDGHGGFTADLNSGVAVHGEGRGAAAADFDGDGRMDLAVGQNGAATTLWHNVGARPGVRVKWKGPAGNPAGYGASVRLVHGDRMGPRHEWHGGSGWWSVDGAMAVLGMAGEPTAIEMRWPGRPARRQAWVRGSREIELAPAGAE